MCGCRAMKVLFKNLEDLSGPVGVNTRGWLSVPGVHQIKQSVDHYTSTGLN